MKNNLLFFLPLFLILSCENSHFEEIKEENQKLKSEAAKKDSTISFFVNSVNRIAENLNSISEKRRTIIDYSKAAKKFSEDEKNIITTEIKLINSLFRQNKILLDSVMDKLAIAEIKIDQFEKLVKNLYLQVKEKNDEINVMKKNLSEIEMAFNTVDFWLDDLTTRNVELESLSRDQKEIIGKQEEQINTAYYRFGTFKELKDAGIITKERGLIIRTEKLLENFSNSEFKKIDIRETVNIPLPGEKVKIISVHPVGSYLLSKVEKNYVLTINNKEDFWKVSKYLVVILEK